MRVVDLSGAFRLADPSAYPAWYGFDHSAPALLAEARSLVLGYVLGVAACVLTIVLRLRGMRT